VRRSLQRLLRRGCQIACAPEAIELAVFGYGPAGTGSADTPSRSLSGLPLRTGLGPTAVRAWVAESEQALVGGLAWAHERNLGECEGTRPLTGSAAPGGSATCCIWARGTRRLPSGRGREPRLSEARGSQPVPGTRVAVRWPDNAVGVAFRPVFMGYGCPRVSRQPSRRQRPRAHPRE
jgi:hypothetical protein